MEHITSRQNALMTHIRKLSASRAYRRASGEYLCDGVKLLEEALRWNAPLKTVVLSECVDAPTLPSGVRAAQGFGQRALPCARRCAGPRQRGHHPAHGGRL